MHPTEAEFKQAAIAAAQKEGWTIPAGFEASETSAILTYIKAGYALATQSVPTSLAALEPLADTIICGARLGQQQLYYKAEDVQALVAKLTAPLADAELAELQTAIADEKAAYKSGSIAWHEYYKEVCQLAYKALPGLLARLAAAEAFKAQVVKVLGERREQAFIDFTANVEDSTGEPIQGAEAGEEINKIIQLLELTMPAETVKGGQPRG